MAEVEEEEEGSILTMIDSLVRRGLLAAETAVLVDGVAIRSVLDEDRRSRAERGTLWVRCRRGNDLSLTLGFELSGDSLPSS